MEQVSRITISNSNKMAITARIKGMTGIIEVAASTITEAVINLTIEEEGNLIIQVQVSSSNSSLLTL